ncbi:hypothetical protein GSH19_04310 [Lactobacillus sp. S2-2]|uniref:hypothetical protein n=1 Tax=Lactobacillus sp. S2-2 TaxID=2692917 RepID=UPI001F41DDAC|nr:hypothetical protein [Lactobacillus sp. S2-2]MCF6515376.1 hypothetical protein [Lactobacillus sp. S2-2]
MNDNLRIAGAIITLIGIFIFAFGKKLFLLRLYFGDRSVFSQIFWGIILIIIGLGLLYASGVFFIK